MYFKSLVLYMTRHSSTVSSELWALCNINLQSYEMSC